MKLTFRILSRCFLALSLSLPAASVFAQAGSSSSATQSTSTAAKKSRSNSAPTAQEIADAKAKGLVWVNTSTHVYHKEGSLYGATKHGKFMTEEDAKKAGYRLAHENPSSSKTATASSK